MSQTAGSIGAEACEALRAADRWLFDYELTGWNPYHGLTLPTASLARGRRARQVIVQDIKRAGPPGRRLLRAPQHRMTKTLFLACAGLRRATWLPDVTERRLKLASEIKSRRGIAAWGYAFDVQTRWGFYPTGSPNVIATAFAVEEIAESLDTFQRDWLVAWFEDEMWTGVQFRYVPGNETLVHKVNVLAARALHRVDAAHEFAQEAVEITAAAPPSGGLLPYGEGHRQSWIDNFHTAYILDALR